MRYVICFRDSFESSCSVVALSWDNPPPLSPPESRLVQLGTRVAWLPMIHDLEINNDIDNRWTDRQVGTVHRTAIRSVTRPRPNDLPFSTVADTL